MKASTTKNKYKVLKFLFIACFWIAIWELIYRLVGRDLYVPSPLSVWNALQVLVMEPDFWHTVFYSLLRVLIGLGLSLVAGSILGLIAGFNIFFHDLMLPLISIIKSTPVMSFIIIALIWFQSSNVPIFICFLMCFPIVWTNIVTGIKQVDKKLIQMAIVYNVRRKDRIKQIVMPSVMPYFTSAIITCLGLGWKVSVAAEVLSHPRFAIGSELYSAKAYLEIPVLFAWTAVVVLLSLLLEVLFVSYIQRQTKKRFHGE